MPLKTRILLADDHAVVRRGLRMVLDAEPDLEVVAEADNGAEAVERALSEEIDLVVIDISMPRLTGLQAVHELRRRRPEPAPGETRLPDLRPRMKMVARVDGIETRLLRGDRVIQ